MLAWSSLLLAAVACAAEVPRCVIIGGTGRIGTAVAAHLLKRCPAESLQVVLAGRDEPRGIAAVQEVRSDTGASSSAVDFLQLDFRNEKSLGEALNGAAAVIHTAGPYAGESPAVLRAALAANVPVYCDLSDPIEYLEEAKSIGESAGESIDTLALCASGAFPGMSNVIAMEAAARLGEPVVDLDFSYFTAGLGGAGEVNLLITNDGFGAPVPVYRNGKYAPQMESGGNTRRVKFFLSEDEPSATLVGERDVWSWPFPEGALVANELRISGDSSVGMGTAPGIWNDVMGLMVNVVPREWWRSETFSSGLASFSRPLVAVTDLFVGQTHAMRIDATSASGARVSAVQAHTSFRRVVGQSCAEFAMALLARRGLLPLGEGDEGGSLGELKELPECGVFTPEELFAGSAARGAMLERLLVVPGTLNAAFEREDGSGETKVESRWGRREE